MIKVFSTSVHFLSEPCFCFKLCSGRFLLDFVYLVELGGNWLCMNDCNVNEGAFEISGALHLHLWYKNNCNVKDSESINALIFMIADLS